jgi:hypothetical protein
LLYPPGIDEKRWGCYYLRSDHNRYRFSMNPNLNKLLTDRRSGVSTRDIDERVKQVVQEAFKTRPTGLECVPFPDKSGQVSDLYWFTVKWRNWCREIRSKITW